jgi:hypothetical protein
MQLGARAATKGFVATRPALGELAIREFAKLGE